MNFRRGSAAVRLQPCQNAPGHRCLNYAAYRAEVVVQDNTFAYAQNIHGMWDIDRYVKPAVGRDPPLDR